MNQILEYWMELPFRRRTIFLQVFGVVASVAILLTLAWPPVYQSFSKILVQDNRAQLLVSPGLQENTSNQPTVVTAPVSEEDLNSEVELITSQFLVSQALSDMPASGQEHGIVDKSSDVVRGIVTLPAAGYGAIHGVRPLTSQEQLAVKLASKVSANVVKRSNIIEVSFKSDDARWSQVFLTHLVNRYLELHALVSHDPKAEQFFQTQAAILQRRLETSERELRAMQTQTGITDLGGQKAALVTQLSNFEADQRKTAAQLAAASEQVAALQRELAETPQRVTKESRVVQNLALQQIKPQVLQLEAERAELLSRYQPDSSRIRQIDAKLAAARKILSQEKQTEVQETTSDLNPVWISIDSQLSEADSNVASLAASVAALNQQVETYRRELDSLNRNGLAIERAQRQVDSDQEIYLSYLRKGEEARAAQALNQSKILNVSVAQPANLPLAPTFPNVPLNLLVGFIAALGLGLAAAHLEERNDPLVFTPRVINEVSGLTTLAKLQDVI